VALSVGNSSIQMMDLGVSTVYGGQVLSLPGLSRLFCPQHSFLSFVILALGFVEEFLE
jgi:hypothetical protein